jgi:hypothetical protein
MYFFFYIKEGVLIEMRNEIQVLVGNHSGERQKHEPELGNCNVKVDLKKFECEGVN